MADVPLDDAPGRYSVRCVLRFRDSSHDGRFDGLYEERITLWRAASFDEAIALAEAEVREYARDLDADYTGLAQSYRLADDPADQGAEVFSLVRDSALPVEDYLDRHFDTGTERQGQWGEAPRP